MTWFTPERPYNELPDLPPSTEVETPTVLRKAITANRYLAELKGSCLRLPRPDLLLNTIVLQESKDSSAIENIVTTQDALYQAIVNPADTIPNEVKEVLRYREAIYAGVNFLTQKKVFTGTLAIQIMQRLRGITAGYRTQMGTQLSNPAANQIVYTPPEPDFIPDKIASWERFANLNEEYDPLVRMALLHYQFEAIHPFSDGNGRTGRILNMLYLLFQNLISHPILYHSSYIIQHKAEYYRSLREITETKQWEPFLLFMLEAVAETSQKSLQFIEQMLALKEETLSLVKGISQKLPAYELNELLFSYPYVKIKTLMDSGLGSRPTTTGYLDELVKRKVLNVSVVGRDKYYINHRLMNLLTT